MKRLLPKILRAGLGIALLTSCGDRKAEPKEQEPIENLGKKSLSQQNQLSMNVELNLAADSFIGVVDECRSGFTKIWEADDDFFVQSGDFDCRFRLKELNIDNEKYTFESIDTWQEGAEFSVVGQAGTERTFRIVSTLDAEIQGDQTIEITSYKIEYGEDVVYTPDVPTGITIGVSQPIGLEVETVRVGVAQSGAGIFKFFLRCRTNSGATTCEQVNIDNLRGVFFRRTTSFQPSWQYCQQIFYDTSNPEMLPVQPVSDQNGLIEFPEVTGPTRLYSPENLDMIFAVGSRQHCKFYNVTIQP